MIRTRSDLKYYLEQDRKALGIKFGGGINFFIRNLFYTNVIWEFQKCMRYLEYYTNLRKLSNLHLWLYYKIKFRRLSLKLNFSIPINVVGPGLSIAHYGTIVISSNAKIGNHCRIHAGVNIGASAGKPEAPKIGDNVYIGPGAILFGGINIADNVTIGANSTVNRSVLEENVVIAGSPAKIVKRDYMNWTELIRTN